MFPGFRLIGAYSASISQKARGQFLPVWLEFSSPSGVPEQKPLRKRVERRFTTTENTRRVVPSTLVVSRKPVGEKPFKRTVRIFDARVRASSSTIHLTYSKELMTVKHSLSDGEINLDVAVLALPLSDSEAVVSIDIDGSVTEIRVLFDESLFE